MEPESCHTMQHARVPPDIAETAIETMPDGRPETISAANRLTDAPLGTGVAKVLERLLDVRKT